MSTTLRSCTLSLVDISRQLRASSFSSRALPTSIPRSYTHKLHTSTARRGDYRPTTLTNILASEVPPPVQVLSVSNAGIKLADGLVLTGPVVFLEGKVYLWDVPNGGFTPAPGNGRQTGTGVEKWDQWSKEHWSIFEVVVPKPEILVFGTGARMEFVPPRIRAHLKELGIQLDVMDTKNASSTYNLLSEEGRRVAAALLPLEPKTWAKKHGF